jgi:predicted nucleic acid-binding Zn ribbon protein
MPTYVYKFIDSGETIEVQQAFTDPTLTKVRHPADGKPKKVKKVFQPVGVTFKGTGFYKNDSRGGSSKSSASSPADSSSSSESSSSSSDSAPAKSTETKSSESKSSDTKSSDATSSAAAKPAKAEKKSSTTASTG